MPIHGGVCRSFSSKISATKAGKVAKFVDGHGPILSAVHVHLIFWGKEWTKSPSGGGTVPTIGSVMAATRSIVEGPYMAALSQYRNIGPGRLAGASLVSEAVETSSAEPPNNFTDSNVSDLISNLLKQEMIPPPGSVPCLLYVVIMPRGITSGTRFDGEHTYYVRSGDRIHFAWITNDGTLDGMTTILSHEIVESCTDPEGNGFTGIAGTCSQEGWCEIGDVCSATGRVRGVLVQSYYSNRDADCIIPGVASS